MQKRNSETDPGVIVINLRQVSELPGAPSYPTLKRWKAAGALDYAKVEGLGERRDLFDLGRVEELLRLKSDGRQPKAQSVSHHQEWNDAEGYTESLREIVRQEVERAVAPLVGLTNETIARLRDLEGLRTKLMVHLDRTETARTQPKEQDAKQAVEALRLEIQRLVVAVRDLQAMR